MATAAEFIFLIAVGFGVLTFLAQLKPASCGESQGFSCSFSNHLCTSLYKRIEYYPYPGYDYLNETLRPVLSDNQERLDIFHSNNNSIIYSFNNHIPLNISNQCLDALHQIGCVNRWSFLLVPPPFPMDLASQGSNPSPSASASSPSPSPSSSPSGSPLFNSVHFSAISEKKTSGSLQMCFNYCNQLIHMCDAKEIVILERTFNYNISSYCTNLPNSSCLFVRDFTQANNNSIVQNGSEYGYNQSSTNPTPLPNDQLSPVSSVVDIRNNTDSNNFDQTGTCMPFDPSRDKHLFLCSRFINQQYIYIPSNSTFDELVDSFLSISFIFTVIPSYLDTCNLNLQQFICNAIFKPCYFNTNTYHRLSIGIPQPICESSCLQLHSSCDFVLQNPNVEALFYSYNPGLYKYLYAPCHSTVSNPSGSFQKYVYDSTKCTLNETSSVTVNQIDNFNSPLFPSNNTRILFSLPNHIENNLNKVIPNLLPWLQWSVPCFQFDVNIQSLLISSRTGISNSEIAVCPPELAYITDGTFQGINQGHCAIPCNSVIYSENEWTIANTIMVIVVPLSFACSLYLFLTFILFQEKRSQTFMVCVSFFMFLLSLAELLSFAFEDTFAKTSCKDDFVTFSQSDTDSTRGRFCLVQGVVIFTSAIAISCFLMSIAAELWVGTIFFARGSKRVYFHIALMIYDCLIIGACFLIGWTTNSYGGNANTPWCGLIPDNTSWIQIAAFDVPIIFNSAFVIIFLVWVVIVYYRSTAKARNSSGSIPYRPILLTIQGVLLIICIEAFRLDAAKNNQIYLDSTAQFVTCLMTTPGTDCGMYPSSRPSIELWYFLILATSGFGIVLFGVHGIHYSNYLLWVHLFKSRCSLKSFCITSDEITQNNEKNNINTPSKTSRPNLLALTPFEQKRKLATSTNKNKSNLMLNPDAAFSGPLNITPSDLAPTLKSSDNRDSSPHLNPAAAAHHNLTGSCTSSSAFNSVAPSPVLDNKEIALPVAIDIHDNSNSSDNPPHTTPGLPNILSEGNSTTVANDMIQNAYNESSKESSEKVFFHLDPILLTKLDTLQLAASTNTHY